MSDLYFSGNHSNKNELSEANFLKHLNILYRNSLAMTEAQKFTDVTNRFEDQSATDKWFLGLKNTIPVPIATMDWAAFCVAFITRFKGADPMLKLRGQLEADLARMRISMGELPKGTVVVRDHQVYALADFVEHLDDAIMEAGATVKDVGLWDFHNVLPAVLQEGIGVHTADWAAMVTVLKAIPQTKIDAAVASYKDREAECVHVDHLEKCFRVMQVSSQGTCGASAVQSAPSAPAVVDTDAATKDQLCKVLTECISRCHPNTPAGLTTYADDIRTWNRKFSHIARAALQLKITGYPLMPSVQSPCTNECWTCEVTMMPAHMKPAGCGRPVLPPLETAIHALGGTWLGRTSLVVPVPVQLITVEPVPVVECEFDAPAARKCSNILPDISYSALGA
ncbi:hypothetical protein B0H10DRAFT_2222399 [Mycena sp. CBHHK59/15]|nr:hypothetical protein B0H10DRAFT_2222399 [Mycena sp. CBHHK59/15]